MADLVLHDNGCIPEADLTVRYVRSPGPGGQNVNKVNTKVELRLRLSQCAALNPGQKRRLREAFPAHVTRAGNFIVTSSRYRSQQRNLQDVLDKLAQMIRSVRHPPKRRIPTGPTRASKRRRVEAKRQRGELKRQRRFKAQD